MIDSRATPDLPSGCTPGSAKRISNQGDCVSNQFLFPPNNPIIQPPSVDAPMIAYAGVKTGFCVRFTERLKLTVLTGECAIAIGFTKKVTTSATVLQSAIDELLGMCVSIKTTKGGRRLALLQAALSNEEIFLKRKDSLLSFIEGQRTRLTTHATTRPSCALSNRNGDCNL